MRSKSLARFAFVMLLLLVQFAAPGWALPRRAMAALCDQAQFIADITIPDGTTLAPGTAFTKTWRLKNIGTCTWTTSYALVFVSGDALGAPAVVNLPSSVAPGATVDLSVNMTAPTSAGHYIGYWKLRNAAGVLFGIGAAASQSFWVEINVSATASVVYDFVASYCSATWTNDAGAALPCPGTAGSADGYVLRKDAPQLENGVTSSMPGLITFPRNITDGYIQGVFPAVTVQSGDRFQAVVGCEYGATSCYVTFRLDYQIGGGAVQTLWSFTERYDGLYYQANVDLSPLAGQNVNFILRVGAYGAPTGDSALWVAPRVVRGVGAPVTPLPTSTPGPTPTPGPTGCDRAQFIADVTIPDGTIVAPGATFTKVWRLKNIGSCTWTTAYKVVFASGDALGAVTASPLPASVPPGSTTDISLAMTAPTTNGHYRGYWLLKNAAGSTFGVGLSGTVPFWVDINVSGSTYGAAYDFYASACDAVWTNGAGTVLPCPGTDGDASGFVLKLASPQLEDGTTGAPGLLTFPQNVTDGVIRGRYPAFLVQSGDRFQAIVNCAYGASGCYVTMRLDYQIGSAPVQTLWSFREKIEGMYYRVDRSLDALAGQNVQFILTVLATGSPVGDRALWVSPRIVRLSP